nr:Pou6 [Halisarca dujardinii]
MSNQTDQISSNQALATVLRFLKQHNLNATVDTLQKEIISGGGSDGTSVDSTPTALTISRNPLGNPEECRQSYVSVHPEELPEMSRLSASPTQADLQPAEVLDDDRGTDSGYSATPSSVHVDLSDTPSTTSSYHHTLAATPTNTSPPCLTSSPPVFFSPASSTVPTTASFFYHQSTGGLGALSTMVASQAALSSHPALVGALPSVLTLVAGQGLARFQPQPNVVIPPMMPLPLHRPFASAVSLPTRTLAAVNHASAQFSPATPTSPLVGGCGGQRLSSSEEERRQSTGDQSGEDCLGLPDAPQLSITELRTFAEDFRRRRISLGYTQGAVGSSLANMGYANFAQSTISRFEQMQLSPRNAASIKEVLAAWLKQAECYPQGALANSDALPPPPAPLPLTSASSIYSTRKRKKRAVFSSVAKTVLEEAFDRDAKPNRLTIERLAKQLDMLPEEVRVWFCNKRQKEKGDRCPSSLQEEEVNSTSTSESPVSSTTSFEEVRTRADSSSEIPQNYRIEEMSKSSSSSPVSFTV